jgi:Domain of unknown function (DUF4340)
MSGNRLLTAIVVLAGLLAITVWQWNKRDAEDAKAPDVTANVPKVKKDDVTELTVKAPGKTSVTLKKADGAWKVTAPVAADADKEAVDSALSKLEELQFIAVAATQKENHEKLEVTDAKGVHVTAKQGDKTLADLWIGTYLSGNTMVREHDAVNVATVKGSLKYAFDKDLKDWRDRVVVDVKTDDVKSIAFTSKNGSFKFVKEGSDWKQAPGEKPIANFDASKVTGLIGTVASLRANDFAADGVSADSAGVGATPVGTITLSTASDAGETQILLRVGNKQDAGYYVAREGKDPIYIVSEYSGDRMTPGADKFTKEEQKAAAALPPGRNEVVYPVGHGPGRGPAHP